MMNPETLTTQRTIVSGLWLGVDDEGFTYWSCEHCEDRVWVHVDKEIYDQILEM